MMIKKIIKTLFLLIFALSFSACLPETDRVFDQKNFLDALSESEISFNANDSNFEIPIKEYEFKDKSNLNNKEVFFGIRPEHIFFKKYFIFN